MRDPEDFNRLRCHGASGGDSCSSLLVMLSRLHGRLSNSPAPWRLGALPASAARPSNPRFPPKKIALAEKHHFRLLHEMQRLALGEQAPLWL